MARCPQTRSARCDPRLQEVQESAITIAGIELMHCISFGINEAAEATHFPFRVSDDPDGGRHAGACPIEHVAADLSPRFVDWAESEREDAGR